MKNDCCSLFDTKNCSDQLKSSVCYQVQGSGMFHEASRRTLNSSTVDPAARHSTNSSCTPHSIEDILSRPRRVHVTSLLLPESRRTSGSVTQGRLYSWSMRSSDDVQRLAQRTGDDDLTWKSMYWSQHSPGSQSRLTATSPTKRGIVEIMKNWSWWLW